MGCANPPQCFVAGTLIHTVDRPKAIETFVGGELALSRHEHTGEAGVRPVVATVATKDQPIYEVVIQDAQGNLDALHTTADHPFWVVNAVEEIKEQSSEVFKSQWVRAASLKPGMRLVDWLGSELIVLRLCAAGWNADVFNIEVHEQHTYHVGELQVWTPNAPCCKFGDSEATLLQRSEITAPNGRAISVVRQDGVVIPTDKVERFARGGSPNPSLELAELQAFKQQDRKAFDLDPGNQMRLDDLKIMQRNFDRSQAMAQNLEKIGLKNTVEYNNLILNNLLETGKTVTATNRVWVPSTLTGPSGTLLVNSNRVILPDGTKYLSTLRFMPIGD